MTLMYRIINLKDNSIIGYFFEYCYAEDYLKECGLGADGLIQQVSVIFSKIEVLQRNVRS